MAVVSYPDDAYLMRVGRLAYAVTYLEGMVLFDLPTAGDDLPSPITRAQLGGKSTGLIGALLCDHAPQISDLAWREYLVTAGEHFAAVAKIRNSVLHARPASTDEGQRLNRAHVGEQFVITDAWLDEQTAAIEQHVRAVLDVRVRRGPSGS